MRAKDYKTAFALRVQNGESITSAMAEICVSMTSEMNEKMKGKPKLTAEGIVREMEAKWEAFQKLIGIPIEERRGFLSIIESAYPEFVEDIASVRRLMKKYEKSRHTQKG